MKKEMIIYECGVNVVSREERIEYHPHVTVAFLYMNAPWPARCMSLFSGKDCLG